MAATVTSLLRIRQVAEVLYNANPDIQPWNGEPYTYQEALAGKMHRGDLALKQAITLAESFNISPR